jgi:hypothetical protein
MPDKEFTSHMAGIKKKLKLGDNDVLDANDVAKFWDLFEEYTGLKTKGERPHGGKEIKVKQLISSAETIWDKSKG